MAVAVFNPSIGPSTDSTTSTSKARTLTAQLGDGYTQVTSDGINTVQETWTLQWDACSNTEMNELTTFFEAQLGYLNFQWTAPGRPLAKLWRCATWGRNPVGPASWTVTATFVQSFDITTLV